LGSAACSLDRSPIGSASNGAAGGGKDGGFAAQSGSGGGVAGTSAGTGASGSGGGSASSATDGGDADSSAADSSLLADAAIDAAPQGYEPGKVGAPCGSEVDCTDDTMDRTCLSETQFAPLLTLPGGYCGKLCDPSLSMPCEAGAACITLPTFPPILVCMRACSVDGDCRVQEGYSCNKPGTSSVSVCSLRN
jgi:hypothetical protein